MRKVGKRIGCVFFLEKWITKFFYPCRISYWIGDILKSLLIKDGLIVTMSDGNRVLNGDILIEGGDIEKIGRVDNSEADEVIDAEGKIVIPGLVCGFTRPCRVMVRGADLKVEPPSDLIQNYQRIRWPLDDEVSKKHISGLTQAACLLMLRTGTTFFAGLHSSQESIGKSLDEVASAIRKSGLRALLGFEASERHTHAEGARGMRENIRFLENIGGKSWDKTRVKGMVGLDAPFVASDELLRHGKRVADEFRVPILISVAKGQVDLYHNLENYGKSTLDRLWDLGVLSDRTVLSDCVHLTEKDISIMERTESSAVLNPMSNLDYGVGTADFKSMKREEISVGLGNDGYRFNAFENLRTFYLVQKAQGRNPPSLSPMQVLRMATIESAKAYGVDDRIGSIEVGKKADITIIDSSDFPTPVSRSNVADHILNTVCEKEVETVVVDGEIVMENRNIKTLEKESVMSKSRKIAKKIWKRF